MSISRVDQSRSCNSPASPTGKSTSSVFLESLLSAAAVRNFSLRVHTCVQYCCIFSCESFPINYQSRSLGNLTILQRFVTMAGTTSPPISLITPDYHFDTLDFIRDLYSSSVYPTFPCPPSLFLDIITTNNLRFELASSTSIDESTHTAVVNLLDRINTFSPEDWVQSMDFRLREWLLVSRVYKYAVALYAMSSLSSTKALPSSPQQHAARSDLRQQLFLLLQEAAACPRAKSCVVWPLVVLGVEAPCSAASQRTFVETELLEISLRSGLSSPLVSKEVLSQFWASGGRGWNACFDRTYALFT
jgi:hypothetical protein